MEYTPRLVAEFFTPSPPPSPSLCPFPVRPPPRPAPRFGPLRVLPFFRQDAQRAQSEWVVGWALLCVCCSCGRRLYRISLRPLRLAAMNFR